MVIRSKRDLKMRDEAGRKRKNTVKGHRLDDGGNCTLVARGDELYLDRKGRKHGN